MVHSFPMNLSLTFIKKNNLTNKNFESRRRDMEPTEDVSVLKPHSFIFCNPFPLPLSPIPFSERINTQVGYVIGHKLHSLGQLCARSWLALSLSDRTHYRINLAFYICFTLFQSVRIIFNSTFFFL